jgi:uncharacterized membrane protein
MSNKEDVSKIIQDIGEEGKQVLIIKADEDLSNVCCGMFGSEFLVFGVLEWLADNYPETFTRFLLYHMNQSIEGLLAQVEAKDKPSH